MKSLTLLRHAKSSWDDPVTRDFDRPINARGHKAAQRMGRYIAEEGLNFDALVASPAARVQETLAAVRMTAPQLPVAQEDRRIYMASAVTLLDLVRGVDDGVTQLMLVGHNPGLEDLVLLLTPADDGALRDTLEIKYPTAALAELRFDVDRWADVAEKTGHLVRFVRPRDLDPDLGPDD